MNTFYLKGQSISCEVVNSNSWVRSANCSQFDLDTEEIRCLPDAIFNVAFHFEADALGRNFTCDPNDPIVVSQPSTTWYAPNLVNILLARMNGKMGSSLLLNGQTEDSKISFKLNGNGTCGEALFTYSHGESINTIPGAMNITFRSNSLSTVTIGGVAQLGGDYIYMNDIINDWVNGNKRHWDVADILLHEFGHTRNLRHTHDCDNPCDDMNGLDVDVECCGQCQPLNPVDDCINCGENKLIMSNSFDPYHFNECEFGEMWNYMINNLSNYQEIELCDLEDNNDKIIYDENSSIVWDSKKIFTKHVIIKSGTTITINCEVLMGGDKEIVVEEGAKLIVNGGKITSICEHPWRGIKVFGGSDSYAVEILGGSTMENTSQGAVSMFHDGGWLLGSGNAHVRIQGSTFNDCNRILALGSVNTGINLSKIEGNVQNGGAYGITNWNCVNVSVTDNQFNDITKSCIVSSGQLFIRGNTFRGFETDILFPNVDLSVSSIIEDNDFHAIQSGITMLGAGIAPQLILKNRFHSNMVNTWMDGDNHYLIDDNSFRGQIGGVFVNNGNYFNKVSRNSIYTDRLGLRMNGENAGFVINTNCYLTSEVDNFITGSIGEIQGAVNNSNVSLRPANNCFSHQGSISSNIEDLFGSTNDFLYIEPDDGYNDCKDAVKAEPNIVIVENGPPRNFFCDEKEDSIPDPCNPVRNLDEVIQALEELSDIINSLPHTSIEYSAYNRCYESVRSIWFELLLKQGDYEYIRASLSDIPTDDSRIIVFKTLLAEGNINAAREYLKSLTNKSEKLNDFITVQLINLKRLESGLRYEVSTSELEDILEIAMKYHSYAAYGKSLYYWITGELLQSELQMYPENEIDERSESNQEKSNNFQLSVFPVPFKNELNIEFMDKLSENAKIIVDNLVGERIFELDTKKSIFFTLIQLIGSRVFIFCGFIVRMN